jgi:HK97 family phage prohead protease
MTELVRRDFTAPVQLLATDARAVAGVISTSALDRWGEVIDPAGVRWGASVKLLWSHDPRSPIGRAERIAVDGDRVLANFRLASAGVDPTADKAHALLRDGIVDSFSVGGIAHKWSGNRCTDFEVVEVSLVAVPANPDAVVTSVRNAPEDSPMVTTDRSGVVRIAGNTRPGAPAIRRSDPAVQRWDFGRFLAMVAPQLAPSDVDFGLEREVSDELNRYSTRSGFKIPLGLLMQRAAGTKPGDIGESLTSVDFRPDMFGLDVEAIRPASIMGRAGARLLTTTEPLVTIPRQTAPLPDAVWIARDADMTLQADLGTRSMDLTPHCVGSYHKILRSGRLYGTPGLVDLYMAQIIEKQLFAVDKAVLYGTGITPQPMGLIADPRHQSFQFGGAPANAAVTLTDLVKMSGLLDGSVAPEDSRVWLMNSLLRSTLQATHKLTGATDSVTILSEGDTTLLQHPIITGQQLPSPDVWFLDAGQVGVCWFAQGAATIEVVSNPYADSVFASGALLLRAINDVDVFAMDAFRSVYAKNALTLGAAGVPVPFAASKPAPDASKPAEDNNHRHSPGRR